MAAQLLEYTTPADARLDRVRAARAAALDATARTGRAHQARACDVSRPATDAPPAATRLVWTPRGLAAMVLLVALVAGVMLSTVVGSFLAVSNERPQQAVPALAAVAPAPVR